MEQVQATTSLTEAEMRDWFNRITSHLVRATETHKELEELKTRFQELNDRVTSLVAQNETLRRDMYAVTVERDRYKKEAEDNHSLADSFMHERDNVRAELNTAHDRIGVLNHELDETKGNLERANRDHQFVQNRVQSLQSSLEYWQNRANQSEKELTEHRTKLSEAESKLKKVQDLHNSIFQAVHLPEVQPVEPPQIEPPKQDQSAEDLDWWKRQHPQVG